MKKIFVSSTYIDLKDERKAAMEVVDRSHHAVAMEKFFAEDHQSKDVCIGKLHECDALVLIVGERYGTVDPEEKVSITEFEYTTAKALGIPVFAFLRTRSDGSWRSTETEDDRIKKHLAFKKRVDGEKYRKEFQTGDQLKIEILGAIANYERQHGELGVRVTALVTPREFFKPFSDPAKLFNHCWTVVGRKETITELHHFIASKPRGALIYGPGTVGKTKILFEFSKQFSSKHRGQALLFLKDNIPLDQESIKQIPVRRTTIVVDDAHRRTDLKFLLQVAQQYPKRIKLVFSARSQGKDFLRTALAEAGFDAGELQDFGDLKKLTKTELKGIAAQVLGTKNSHLIDQLVSATGDSPLVTLVGAQLLLTQSIDPRLLERHDEFRFTVLSRFEDTVTGKLADNVDANLTRRLLALISALAPVRPDDQQFQGVAADFLGIKKPVLVDVIGILEEQGTLVRRGYSLRINPDVLSDHILHKACLTRNGQTTGFADEVFNAFSKIAAERILRNLAELDWRLGKTGNATSLLERIWKNINRQFRRGSNFDRVVILDWLQRIAYYQPAKALALVEFAIHHPSRQSGNEGLRALYKYTHHDILGALPRVIQAVGYNIEYLPRCCDLLWQLGRNDVQKPASNLESPLRILAEFAKYDVGKPLFVNKTVFEQVEKWLAEKDCHSYLHSPFDILDEFLRKEILSSRSEGIQFHLSTHGINPKTTKDLRQRTIKLLENSLQSKSIKVVLRALHSLSEALRSPPGQLARVITEEERQAWLGEQMQILAILGTTVRTNNSSIIHLRVSKSLRWYSKHGSPAVRQKAATIIRSIPETFDYLLTKSLWYDHWEWRDELEDSGRQDYEAVARETENKVALIAKDFLQRYTKPAKGYSLLRQYLSDLSLAGIAANADYFLNILSNTNSNYAEKLCELIVKNPKSNLATHLAALLSGVRRDRPKSAARIITKAIKTRDETLCYEASRFYGYSPDGIEERDLPSVERLLRHKSVNVRRVAIHALESFKDKESRKLIEVIKRIRISQNTDIAEAVCQIFDHKAPTYGIPFAALRDRDISAILNGLVQIPEIGDHQYHIDKFLGYATERNPFLVARFFFKRLDIRGKRRKNGTRFNPLSFLGFRYALRNISSRPEYKKIIAELLRRAARADSLDKFWLPIFFKDISDGYCRAALDNLKPWITSGDLPKLEAAALLLRSAPADFLFDQKDFVIELLETAHAFSEDCYQSVVSDLFSCAVSGLREGTPGEPKNHDVNIRNRSEAALASLQPGSPAYRFYESLVRYAEGEIKDDIARFEENFQD
jgi:Domain of unknown function (DUF4062)